MEKAVANMNEGDEDTKLCNEYNHCMMDILARELEKCVKTAYLAASQKSVLRTHTRFPNQLASNHVTAQAASYPVRLRTNLKHGFTHPFG